MSRKKSGRGRANGIPSLAAPKNLEELRAVDVNVGQTAPSFNVPASRTRRWTHRPTLSARLGGLACTTFVVLVWCLMITGIILAMCAALYVVAP